MKRSVYKSVEKPNSRLSFANTQLSSILVHSANASHPPWSRRERMSWLVNTNLTPDEVVKAEESTLTIEWLQARGVTSRHFIACGTDVRALKSRGCSLQDLTELGYDMLDMVGNPDVADGLVAAYGCDDVINYLCRGPSDAVAVAGTHAQKMLCLSPELLLQRCAGLPEYALGVLKQLGPVGLRGVQAATLLQCELDAPRLAAAGHGIMAVSRDVLGSTQDIAKLGFRV